MVWNSTTEVGIAMAFSDSGKTYVLARYSLQGILLENFHIKQTYTYLNYWYIISLVS